MKVVVDLNRCQGYGQCVYAAPNIFQLKGPEILAYDPAPPEQCAMRSSARYMPVRYVQSGPRSTAHWSIRPRPNEMQRAWPISPLHRRAESSSPEPRWPACPLRRHCGTWAITVIWS